MTVEVGDRITVYAWWLDGAVTEVIVEETEPRLLVHPVNSHPLDTRVVDLWEVITPVVGGFGVE